MNTTLLFFALLVPVSGFIAWAGDKIGHVIGKRRHSLFGLRPRHTATLITILSGVGITAASFGAMFLSSESFRDVVQRGSQLRRENEQLSEQIRQSGQRVRLLQSDATRADQERQKTEKARDEAALRRTEAEGKFVTATKSLAQAEAALTAEKGHLGRTQGSLEAAQRQVTLARSAVDDARLRRERAEAAAKLVEGRLATARGEAKRAQILADRATSEFNLVVQEQKRRLEGQRSELEKLGGRVTEQTQRLSEQQRTLEMQEGQAALQKQEVARLATELEQLEKQRKELEKRRDEAQESVNDVFKITVALRNGQISYRVGEEVARLSVATGNEWKVHNILEGLLTTASRQAERRGARTAPGAIRSVWIPDRRIADDSGKLQTLDEVSAIHTAALNISKSKEEVVVVVTALGNAVVGEPVPVDIRTWRNPLILTAGQSLGELTLDGNKPGAEIADRLYNFLRGEVRKKLLDAGTIPIGELGQQSVGETSMDTLLKALDSVRAIHARARVTVRAAKDLRAADPVALEFEVKPLEPPIVTIPPGLR